MCLCESRSDSQTPTDVLALKASRSRQQASRRSRPLTDRMRVGRLSTPTTAYFVSRTSGSRPSKPPPHTEQHLPCSFCFRSVYQFFRPFVQLIRTLSHACCQALVHRCRRCRREVFGAASSSVRECGRVVLGSGEICLWGGCFVSGCRRLRSGDMLWMGGEVLEEG